MTFQQIQEKIQTILSQHYIEYVTINGHTLAESKWMDKKTGKFECEYTDVSNMSKRELYDWLGY